MPIFRRKTIFHAEESLPDPEELKIRFRRRVLITAAVAFAAVLSVPVARDLYQDLRARAEARDFAVRFLDSRLLAAKSRGPVALELADDGRHWRQVPHGRGDSCATPVPGPEDHWGTDELRWKLQGQKETGETFTGRSLCLSPFSGLHLDGTAVASGRLLVTVLREAEGQEKPAAYVMITQAGAEIQTLSAGNH